MTWWNRLYAWLWSFLPDKCELAGAGCPRKGVRGNENVVDGIVLCDYCMVRYQKWVIGSYERG